MKKVFPLLLPMALALWGAPFEIASAAGSLRAEMARLSRQHGFPVGGLEVLGEETAQVPAGTLLDRIKSMLQGYNFVLVEDGNGGVRRLYVTSAKQLAADSPQQHVVYLQRHGRQQVISAVLTGSAGNSIQTQLIVDTGANHVVLPVSMIAALGLDENGLEEGWSQTANGRVRARFGQLRELRLGSATARDVAVSFIADDRLGGAQLLGMSFLGRFEVTLDPRAARLVLVEK